jgi:hypothetical protein
MVFGSCGERKGKKKERLASIGHQYFPRIIRTKSKKKDRRERSQAVVVIHLLIVTLSHCKLYSVQNGRRFVG